MLAPPLAPPSCRLRSGALPRGNTSSNESRGLAPPALRDRHLPSAAECLLRDANRRRGLPPFEFIRIDGPQNLLDQRAIVPGGHDLIDFAPLLDVQAQDAVEH